MQPESLKTQEIHQVIETLERDVSRLRRLVVEPEASQAATGVANAYVESVPGVLGGEPVVAGTRTPVRAIVEYWRFGTAPEEIARMLPHLRLAQVFAALSYYDDHRAEIERHIAANRVPVDG